MNREHFFTCIRSIMPECQIWRISETRVNVYDPISDYYIGRISEQGPTIWDFGDKSGIEGGSWVEVTEEEEVFKYLKKFKEDRNELKEND